MKSRIFKYTWFKGILVGITAIGTAFIAIFLVIIMMFGSSIMSSGSFSRDTTSFLQSNTFVGLYRNVLTHEFENARLLNRFETNGVFNPNLLFEFEGKELTLQDILDINQRRDDFTNSNPIPEDLVFSDETWNEISNIRWDFENYNTIRMFQANSITQSNFHYIFVDSSKRSIISNNPEFTNYANLDQYIQRLEANDSMIVNVIEPFTHSIQYQLDDGQTVRLGFGIDTNNWDGVYVVAIDTSFQHNDVFAAAFSDYITYVAFVNHAWVFTLLISLLLVFVFILLVVFAGRKNNSDLVHLNWFDRIWTEFAIGIPILFWIICSYVFGQTFSRRGSHTFWSDSGAFLYESIAPYQLVITGFYAAISISLFLLVVLSITRRIKGKVFWKNCFIYRFHKILKHMWFNRQITFRVITLMVGFLLLHYVILLSRAVFFIFLLILVDMAALAFLYVNAMAKNRIKNGIKEIAEGNITFQIPTQGLFGENLIITELVNSIGDGLHEAVDQSLKAERMKTDLITNVSHDIKTPLTSIINYIDLLKRENFTDPKIQNYLEILDIKSQQLKNLTEDVVEASKVSSGNVTLEKMDLNLIEMLHQIEGEFEERFEEKKLTYLPTCSVEKAIVHVDGKRMWRILENIYTNVVKYTMPGTRVYSEITLLDDYYTFSLKNVSEQPLNITVDELTERFIRGDASRTTEGSGLGLSIAKSLTELMGGIFNLKIDGDLFTVEISFMDIIYPQIENTTTDRSPT